MLENFLLQTQLLSAHRKREALVKEKMEVMKELQTLNITMAQVKKAEAGVLPIDMRLVERRKWLGMRQKEIEEELIKVNLESKEVGRKIDSEENRMAALVFREIFDKEQLHEIFTEVRRRINGEQPSKLMFNVTAGRNAMDEADKFKKSYLEELEKMQEIRLTLTRIIEEGSAKFGDAEFMKVISPLNRMVIPIKEINKKKLALSPRNHLLNS